MLSIWTGLKLCRLVESLVRNPVYVIRPYMTSSEVHVLEYNPLQAGLFNLFPNDKFWTSPN